ncbi:MAG: hypothetical protein JSS65_10260 [Armatimonadetes bacterium]|nr:hypothetical protein [Armatimonadota bacterium]
MNQRDHDMIVRAAYGESEPGEKAAVEALLSRDIEARELYEEYAGLQSGLRELDNVPACQLSTERLRLAVLNSQVRRPSPLRLYWGYGLAAACLAVGFVALRPQAGIQPSANTATTIVPKTTPLDVANPPVVATTTPESPTADLAHVMENGAGDKAVEAVAPPTRPRSIRHKPSALPMAKASVVEKTAVDDTNTGRSAVVGGQPATSPATDYANRDANMVVATYVPEGPVVVVQPETDPRTGAALAFESNHGSDFVFGG